MAPCDSFSLWLARSCLVVSAGDESVGVGIEGSPKSPYTEITGDRDDSSRRGHVPMYGALCCWVR